MNCLKCNGTGQYEDKITGLTIKCECQNVKNASGLKDNCVIDNVVPSGVNTDGYIAPMTPNEVARNNGELTAGDNESAFAHGIIPKHREDDEFSPDYTRNYINECYKYDKIPVRGLDKYIELLSKILLDIRSDKRLDRSYFISAHNGYGKTTFANTCIKYLHKAGKKVVPYLSLQEIYNIVIAENLLLRINKAYITQDEKRVEHSLENSDKYVNWKANKQTGAVFEQYNINAFVENYATFNFSYADFINCEILFTCFSPSFMQCYELPTLKMLLQERSRRGKATIVFGDQALGAYIKQGDNDECGKNGDTRLLVVKTLFHFDFSNLCNIWILQKGLHLEYNTGRITKVLQIRP